MYARTDVHIITSGYPYAVLAILILFSFSLLTIYSMPPMLARAGAERAELCPLFCLKICFYRAFYNDKTGGFNYACRRFRVALLSFHNRGNATLLCPCVRFLVALVSENRQTSLFFSARPRRLAVFFYHSGTSAKSSIFYAVILSRVRLCNIFDFCNILYNLHNLTAK